MRGSILYTLLFVITSLLCYSESIFLCLNSKTYVSCKFPLLPYVLSLPKGSRKLPFMYVLNS